MNTISQITPNGYTIVSINYNKRKSHEFFVERFEREDNCVACYAATRRVAARVVELGGTIAKSVTKTLNVLVATSNTSSKWKKAEELNASGAQIALWTEEEFMKKLEEMK